LHGGAAAGVPRELSFALEEYAAEIARALTEGAVLLRAPPTGLTRQVYPDQNAHAFAAAVRSG
jgi:hypothetical protein